MEDGMCRKAVKPTTERIIMETCSCGKDMFVIAGGVIFNLKYVKCVTMAPNALTRVLFINGAPDLTIDADFDMVCRKILKANGQEY